MSKHTNRIFQLSKGQVANAAEGAAIRLNPRQQWALQDEGVLAAPDEYWRHPEGQFMLMPLWRSGKRERVNLG